LRWPRAIARDHAHDVRQGQEISSALLAAGVDAAHLYDDHASGRNDDRPGLASCLKALRDGDTLVVWKLDRLGRNLHHLVNTVHELTARGVGLKVLTGQGAAIDTTTAAGKLVFGIFAALAEFVSTYGEEAAATFAEGLGTRIRNGEFSVEQARQ